MSGPLVVTSEDVEKNLRKLWRLTTPRVTKCGKWRGTCPSCGEKSLVLERSESTKKILLTCHNNTFINNRDEHRKEIFAELHSQGIYLSEYYPVPLAEMILAEFPLFRLDRKKDQQIRTIEYEKGIKIELIPSVMGHPTAWDEPLYLYAVRIAKNEFDRQGIAPEWVKFHVMDYLRWAGGRETEVTGFRSQIIEKSLMRMKGLQIVSTIEYQQGMLFEGEGLILGWKYGKQHQMDPGMVGIRLAGWTISQIKNNRIIHLSEDFFSLPPLQRKIYQVLQKHLGKKREFLIGIEKLKLKTGFSRETKKFRYELRSNPNILDITVHFLPDKKILAKRSIF